MSGLHALCGFRLHRSFDTPADDMFICGILEWGLCPFSGIYVSVSFVNTTGIGCLKYQFFLLCLLLGYRLVLEGLNQTCLKENVPI